MNRKLAPNPLLWFLVFYPISLTLGYSLKANADEVPAPVSSPSPLPAAAAPNQPAQGIPLTITPSYNTAEPAPAEPAPAKAQGIPLTITPTYPAPTADSGSAAAVSIVQIVSPNAGAILDVPAVAVTLQYPLGKTVELRVNGKLIGEDQIGRTEENAATQQVSQTWYGVPLKEGDNLIEARVEGAPTWTSTQVVVRGIAVKLSLTPQQTRIPADGTSTVTISGDLLDAKGNRTSQNAVVTLDTTGGEFVEKDAAPDQPGYQVRAVQGQFTVNLKAGLSPQQVTLRARTGNNLEAFSQLQFTTNLRPSIMTGVIDLRLGNRGTDYYGSFREFLPIDLDNHTEFKATSQAFATGRIGEWSITGAYNTIRSLNQDCNGNTRLFRDIQFCDQNYPVYGDGSTFTTLTPSKDSIFLRIERNSPEPRAGTDFGMWGDYNIEEFSTRSQQFTSFSRPLHGLKLNYNLGNVQVTGFYGDNVQGFQRDTIAPDGTSGYYFLSRRLLVPGSEQVVIELEELNRPGNVVARQSVNRGPDYEIDYARGSLLFRQPLLRTDLSSTGEVLVRRVLITYQYENQTSGNDIYGGRVRYHLSRDLNQESWIGTTYLRENQGSRRFELYGADALISFGPQNQLIAEYARSTNTADLAGTVSGSAVRLEALGQLADGIQGRAYFRSIDAGFSNNATVSFVPGQTRYGAQVSARVADTTQLRLQYDHEDNYGVAPRLLTSLSDLISTGTQAIPGSAVDNSLTTITAGVTQKLGIATVDLAWLYRDRQDRISPKLLSGSSSQLRSSLTIPIASDLVFQALNETSISSSNDAVFPDRTLLALNWTVIPGITIRLSQQFFSGTQYSGQSLTSLDVAGEYPLGTDTTLTGRYSILGGANSTTTQGAIGLNNRWTIAPGLRLNLAYERIFGSFFGLTAAGTQFPQPYAVGQAASALGVLGGDSFAAGLEYTGSSDFQASARYEFRSSSTGSNTVISAGATGKISPALTGLFRYQQANTANQTLTGLLGDTVNVKVGLAYRDPNDDRLNALLRYEYRQNPATIPETIFLGTGTGSTSHLFGAEVIYAPDWQWEFYGKFAMRSSTSYLASDLVGTTTISLGQLRATYRMGYDTDLVGEVRWIGQPSAGYSETGFVIEAGYYLSPDLRLAVGYSFGSINSDRDFTGSRSAGGFYAGLTLKLNELFDGFGRQSLPPPQTATPNNAKEAPGQPPQSPANSNQPVPPAQSTPVPEQPKELPASPEQPVSQKD